MCKFENDACTAESLSLWRGEANLELKAPAREKPVRQAPNKPCGAEEIQIHMMRTARLTGDFLCERCMRRVNYVVKSVSPKT